VTIDPLLSLTQGRSVGWRPPAHREAEFEAFLRGFQAARAAAGGADRFFALGGFMVKISFAGEPLERQMTPALAHTEVPPADPDLTVFAWDTESTGVCLPAAAGALEDHLSNALPGAVPAGPILSGYLRPDSGLSMLDTGTSRAVYWVPDAARIPPWDFGGPFRGILSWWLGMHGRQFLHAAAVGTREAGVVIAGKSGSGKSTTAVACLQAGLAYAGEDYCLLQAQPGPRAYTVYCSAKLTSQSLGLLPAGLPAGARVEEQAFDKEMFLLDGPYGEHIVDSFPVVAVLLPRIVDRVEPALLPAGRAAALAGLAPSTLLQLPGDRSGAFRELAAVVEQVPAFTLELGRDPSLVAPLILALLDRLKAGSAELQPA
jgi:hypothetical protein